MHSLINAPQELALYKEKNCKCRRWSVPKCTLKGIKAVKAPSVMPWQGSESIEVLVRLHLFSSLGLAFL